MHYLIVLLSFLFLPTGNTSTNPDPGPDANPRLLSIQANGQVELPADKIQFNINLNAEAEKPQAAYGLHKKREKALVLLLKKYGVREKDIRYEPISISKIYDPYDNSEKKPPRYLTRQMVNLTLSDFDIYEKIQVGLIENGYDNFSGSFISTNAEKGKDEALKKAIRTARDKARLIAREAGIKLGSVVRVNYSHNEIRPYYEAKTMMREQSSSDQLLQFEQSVTVTASISMDFEIVE